MQDSDTIQDLYKIEEAMLGYYYTHNSLPPRLSSLDTKKLKGAVNNYRYNPSAHTDVMGPGNEHYSICATFKTQTIRLPLSQDEANMTKGGTADAYADHRKGLQCFNNDIYKDGSHISPILNKGEIVPPETIKTYHPDFAKLLLTAQTYYNAHLRALGIQSSAQDFDKFCIQIAGPGSMSIDQNTASDAANKKAFNCSIAIKQEIDLRADLNNDRVLVTNFISLLKNEGFNENTESETGSADETNTLKQYQDYTASTGDGCNISVNYRPEWSPPAIEYVLDCSAPSTSDVPTGYRQVADDNYPI